MSTTHPHARSAGPRRVHAPIRPAWLALGAEEPLTSDVDIIDSHHHLWNRPGDRYLLDDFDQDAVAFPRLRASVYVQSRTGYRTTGRECMRSVGEVEFAAAVAAESSRSPRGQVAAAIIAGADLDQGDTLNTVLDAMLVASDGRLRGIRNQTAWHSDPSIVTSPFPPPPGRLSDPAFRDGAELLGERGLVLDIWAYESQLDDVVALAEECPRTRIVVDHLGGPLSTQGHSPRPNTAWSDRVRRLAELPNVHLKISGIGLRSFGLEVEHRDRPPSSAELATVQAPFFDVLLTEFTSDRLMFGSNFPVDKGIASYTVLWNSYFRLCQGLAAEDIDNLFARTASSVYSIT